MRFKLIFVLFISFALTVSVYIISEGRTNIYKNGNSKDNQQVLLKDDVLKQRDKYITVGLKGCEFKTLKEALAKVNSKRSIIYLIDDILTEANIIIDENVEIRGFGKDKTIIQAAKNLNVSKGRVFLIEKNAKVGMNGVTIRYGRIAEVPRCGGGIYNKGILTISNCAICDNMGTYGVGINNEGILEMGNCTISRNSGIKRPPKDQRNGIDCGGSGCGIKIERKGVAKISGCLISDNISIANGGGLHVSCEGKASLINCTIINNNAEYEGGGISVRGDLNITHCTITKNRANKGNGIYVMGGKVNAVANIIAGNYKSDLILASGFGFYENGTVEKNDFNLIESGSTKGFLRTDPGLLPLGENGGPTMTCALKGNSPAIDVITSEKLTTEIDQRGVKRSDEHPDIGAYEYVK